MLETTPLGCNWVIRDSEEKGLWGEHFRWEEHVLRSSG